jgi:3-oxoacyl-[acyl-carrier protein] reductase
MNTKRLKVFVSASTRGIGYSVAARFAREGCDIAICGRDTKRLEEARRKLTEINSCSNINVYLADLSDRTQQDELFRSLDQDGFHPDIYICNTGQPARTRLTELNREQWDTETEMIIGNAVFASKQFVTHMAENHFGRFIFISSTYAKSPGSHFLAGSIARGGLFVLSKAIVDQYASNGIASFVLCIGYVDTPLLRNMALGNDFDAPDPALTCSGNEWITKYSDWSTTIPSGRIASADELAEVIHFLSTPAAEYLNGSVLSFSGGLDKNLT